ncbi:MAG: hypothetical protein ING66_01005 [Rhodocyclaceae bacterium]|jgi:hypothetical protein|nr:hypothetical protein [Rhodocyclaceae bacterium]MCA3027149.1 hypothetical protein [Rhodocyclaceae bacterium]MCA3032668.1 hypothetical protein [Rhodocyclaceae bacterium]MCA3037757.1 hypothetical protein [Rhodocyclaceae bacterium]MCA3046647.1 hypothetical protein [Rhodocyclaceae bacterium]
MADRLLCEVFRLIGCGKDIDAAALLGSNSRSEPTSQLAKYLLRYFEMQEQVDVYDQPRAFRAFIDGGGNVHLYSSVVSCLRRLVCSGTKSLIDIGCGDGRVTSQICDGLQLVEFVEPSHELFQAATRALAAKAMPSRGYQLYAQNFLQNLQVDRRWDVATMTFSLQCVSPAERLEMLTTLRGHVGKVGVVEFDVHAFPTEEQRYLHLIERYEIGINEYSSDRDLVALGFLIPMLLSQLRSTNDHQLNWEQSKESWLAEFQRANYSDVTVEKVADYWWADCFMVVANGA